MKIQNTYARPIIAFTKANLLRFFRDKTYLFFMFILPVMFLVIFGLMYGNNFTSFKTAIFNHSDSEIASATIEALTVEDGVLEVKDVEDFAAAEEQLVRGELEAIVEFPEDFGVMTAGATLPSGEISVIYSQNAVQAGQAISAVIDGAATQLNQEIAGQIPHFTVKSTALNRAGLSNFDYVFAGLLGYTVLTLGLMGIANLLPGDKKTGATKRLRATTMSKSQFIFSYALTFLLVGVLMIALMVVVGIIMFGFQMRGNWLYFALFTAIGAVMMLGFGLAVGGWARNDAQASALANILMFPMMFLSGVFFPAFMMPDFIQTIMKFMPLTPIVDGIRLIITENYSLIEVAPQLGLIALWGIVIYFIAIRVFRWD